jgi:peptidoglycan-associated lipoprotein
MRRLTILAMTLLMLAAACAKKQPAPVPQPAPPSSAAAPPAAAPAPPPPAPAQRVEESVPVPAIGEDTIGNRTLEDLNRNSPLQPAFFGLDSAELDDAGRAVVSSNADILKKYPAWMVTIEGHCDERGTAEYNLAGKEFPFDPGHSEAAWSKNRRAHFVITSK